MYRIAKKTTKRTSGHCLKCKHHKELRKVAGGGVIIECTAPNRCMMTEFNSNDYYCVEYKGINEMTQSEKDAILRSVEKESAKKAFRAYANKYYPKKQAKQMIKEYNEKMKRG